MSMYEMYPEWPTRASAPSALCRRGRAPAHDVEDHPVPTAVWTVPLQESLDLRDNGGHGPDDEPRK